MEEKLEDISRRTVMIDAVAKQVSKRVKTELPVLFSKTESLDSMLAHA
jgi:transcriptional antiterminator